MAKADLTAQRLRELLDYDPETGIFTRTAVSGVRGRWKAGTVAGAATAGRIQINVDGVIYKAHRLAWLHVHGSWPTGVIDHVNGNGLDNRIANLRDVSQRVNMENCRRGRSSATSKLLGVSWDEQTKRWRAAIQVSGKFVSLGRHTTEEEAHEAYLIAKRRLHEGCTI